jgi:SAM-dependent methyltransferase
MANKDGSTLSSLAILRRLPLSEFGAFFIRLPDPAFPALSRILPSMASDEVQRHWTGAHGMTLLSQTLSFVKIVDAMYRLLNGRDLTDARVLDFGCGYGRIIRLMYHFTEPHKIYGVDPFQPSLELCRKCGMPGNFYLSDPLPDSFPFSVGDFDLIYAFSVYTHLSMKATRKTLQTLRKYISDRGVLVITIRPVEFWPILAGQDGSHELVAVRQQMHRSDGFVFVPQEEDGKAESEITYGNTSISLQWLEDEIPEWKVRAHVLSPDDPMQIIVFLSPVLDII